MEYTFKLNNLRIAPRKVRSVIDSIRGKDFNTAVNQLRVINRRAALPVIKLMKSGLGSLGLKENHLYVKRTTVDEGPVLKRHLPRAMGRAGLIKKRSSHITLVLENKSVDAKSLK